MTEASSAITTPSITSTQFEYHHPSRLRAITCFVLGLCIFTMGIGVGTAGLMGPLHKFPSWLKISVLYLGKKGCIMTIVSSYMGSALITELGGPIHDQKLLDKGPKTTKCEKLFEVATRIPRAILATVFDIVLLPGAGILLLVALFKSDFDPKEVKTDKTPILLLHGSGFNQTEWLWGKSLFLRKESYGSVFSMNLDGLVENEDTNGIDDYAKKVAKKVEEIFKRTGQSRIHIIGHSMGGLVGGYYAENLAPTKETVVSVISVATPWQGAPLLNCKNKESMPKRYTQMSEDSSFLYEFRQQAIASVKDGTRKYYTIGSTTDFMVPAPSSSLGGETAVRNFSYLGHYGLIISPTVWMQIRSWLDENTTVSH